MNFPTVLLALAILLGPLLTSAHAQTPARTSANEYKKGRAYLEAKDYPRAIEHLNNSIAIMPSSGAYMDLGIVYYRLKNYQDAIAAFRQVVRMAPNNPEVHYWLAWTHVSQANEFSGCLLRSSR